MVGMRWRNAASATRSAAVPKTGDDSARTACILASLAAWNAASNSAGVATFSTSILR